MKGTVREDGGRGWGAKDMGATGTGAPRRLEDGTPDWVVRADEATLAVVAHGLLRSITVVQGGVETLRRRWDSLETCTRNEIMQAVMDHAVLIGASLQDLVRGMPLTDVPSTDNGDASPARAAPSWVPTYANCPRCRYRGVYVVSGRWLIRCRYCRAMAGLAEGECAEASEHPERFVTRLVEAYRKR